MRYIRYAFLAILAVFLITVALANRGAVTLRLLPETVSTFLDFSGAITLPLFIVIFLGIIGGIFVGFVWEWMREHHLRVEGATSRRERDRLAREVDRLKGPGTEKGDDVLALLD